MSLHWGVNARSHQPIMKSSPKTTHSQNNQSINLGLAAFRSAFVSTTTLVSFFHDLISCCRLFQGVLSFPLGPDNHSNATTDTLHVICHPTSCGLHARGSKVSQGQASWEETLTLSLSEKLAPFQVHGSGKYLSLPLSPSVTHARTHRLDSRQSDMAQEKKIKIKTK